MYEARQENQATFRQGQSLQDARIGELIATIIDADELSALSIGDQIESEITLASLPAASLPELEDIAPGIDRTQFAKIMAAVELGRRVAEAKTQGRLPEGPLNSSAVAIEYCRNKFSRLATDGRQEECHVITLDSKNRVINSHRVTVGTLDASLIHPREMFRPAIKDSAASMIVVHNHPSGDPTPSKEDFSITERLETAGRVLGIDLTDHIIVAREGTVSIRETETSLNSRG